MNNHDEIRLLLELYADGEIDAADRVRVERRLEEDAGAREYLLALEEVSTAVKLPIEMATEAVSFEGLFERVMADAEAAASTATVRSAELEMLAMAFADGESLSTEDQRRVDAYLEAVPEAREGVAAIHELGDLTRMPIELAAETVDFDRLAARIQSAVMADAAKREHVVAPADVRPSLWERVVGFVGEHRGAFVSAMVSALLVASLLPRLTSAPAQPEVVTETVVHNHYYSSYGAESVNYQPGYWGASQPGDIDEGLAPVIWIAPQPIEKVQTPEDMLVPVTPRPGERSL